MVFTQEGVAMLSGVLHSPQAIKVNIAIMRAFIRFRELVGVHKDIIRRLDVMEGKYDNQFKIVFDAIRELMQPPEKPVVKIGFQPK